MDHKSFLEKRDPKKVREWLMTYIGHEHLADIKEVSLEKFLAVAPDIYVMAAMLYSALSVSEEQREFGEYGKEDYEIKLTPWNELTAEEKISQEEVRKYYMAGIRRGRDTAMIEMANRIIYAMRNQLDRYRLENPEYDPALVVHDDWSNRNTDVD